MADIVDIWGHSDWNIYLGSLDSHNEVPKGGIGRSSNVGWHQSEPTRNHQKKFPTGYQSWELQLQLLGDIVFLQQEHIYVALCINKWKSWMRQNFLKFLAREYFEVEKYGHKNSNNVDLNHINSNHCDLQVKRGHYAHARADRNARTLPNPEARRHRNWRRRG